MNVEMLRFAQKWATRTEEILRQEIDRLDVKDTEALREGLNSIVKQEANKTIIELRFKKYGRYVDIGIKSKKQTREKLVSEILGSKNKKQKNDKRWYSPVWFGRVSKLYAAIGFDLVEKVIKTKVNA
ncbi:hypothetical protein V9L05_15340 [Bernardetia sp. Wsw4-3y2]|uniref:hypothetical protein n=1 Tax=Bernardetia sp. Wsw4-3y2 TaxID=3127471 RepID=UPI0030D290FB